MVAELEVIASIFIHAEPVSTEDWQKDAEIAFGSAELSDWDAVLEHLEPFDMVSKWFDWNEYE